MTQNLNKGCCVLPAAGKADLVLKGGNVFNSFTGEWETADVAVCGSVIAGIGSYKGAEEYNMGGQIFNAGLSGRAYAH